MLRSQEFPLGDIFSPELPEELGNGDSPFSVTEGTRLFGSPDLKGFNFLGVVTSTFSGVWLSLHHPLLLVVAGVRGDSIPPESLSPKISELLLSPRVAEYQPLPLTLNFKQVEQLGWNKAVKVLLEHNLPLGKKCIVSVENSDSEYIMCAHSNYYGKGFILGQHFVQPCSMRSLWWTKSPKRASVHTQQVWIFEFLADFYILGLSVSYLVFSSPALSSVQGNKRFHSAEEMRMKPGSGQSDFTCFLIGLRWEKPRRETSRSVPIPVSVFPSSLMSWSPKVIHAWGFVG